MEYSVADGGRDEVKNCQGLYCNYACDRYAGTVYIYICRKDHIRMGTVCYHAVIIGYYQSVFFPLSALWKVNSCKCDTESEILSVMRC